MSNLNDASELLRARLKNRPLPKGTYVVLTQTPNNGDFAIIRVCPDGQGYEIQECDKNGNIIHRISAGVESRKVSRLIKKIGVQLQKNIISLLPAVEANEGLFLSKAWETHGYKATVIQYFSYYDFNYGTNIVRITNGTKAHYLDTKGSWIIIDPNDKLGISISQARLRESKVITKDKVDEVIRYYYREAPGQSPTLPFVETSKWTGSPKQEKIHESRTLPSDSKWTIDRVAEVVTFDEITECGDARNAPEAGATIIETSGNINGYGPYARHQVYSRVVSSEKKSVHFETYYKYKDGYFNPWIATELLWLYLESLSLGKRSGEGSYEGRSSGFLGSGGIYDGAPFGVTISAQSCYLIILQYESDNAKAFNSLAGIIETFLYNGFKPDDQAVYDRIVQKYTPVKITSKTFWGSHDNDIVFVTLYNAIGEEITTLEDPATNIPWTRLELWAE